MMNKYKLIQDIDKVIKKENNKNMCMSCIKAGCMTCGKNNNSDSQSEDEDEYKLNKIYKFGGSDRYSYRKKKYNMVKKDKRKQHNKKWMDYVEYIKVNNPNLPYKECLKLASITYKL